MARFGWERNGSLGAGFYNCSPPTGCATIANQEVRRAMSDMLSASWREIYGRCRSLKKMEERFSGFSLFRQARNDFRLLCSLHRRRGNPFPEKDAVDWLAILDRLDQERCSGVYEDVYHAAVGMLCDPELSYDPAQNIRGELSGHAYIHRGQRKSHWSVSPSIMRPSPGSTVTREQVLIELRRTGAFVGRLRQIRPCLDEPHAAAIAQHYSKEADVRTWLIDMTRDPFVALWFASQGGEAGDIGIVESIGHAEWNEIANIPGSPFGPVRLLEPENVSRLSAQHGLFLEAPNGTFWSLYVKPRSYKFNQKNGLVFEDREIGISKSQLMPDQDDLKKFAIQFSQEFPRELSTAHSELQRQSDLMERLFTDYNSPDIYYIIARHFAIKMCQGINDRLDSELRSIARFHATLLLPQWSQMLSGCWSIRRFILAVQDVAIHYGTADASPWRKVVHQQSMCGQEIEKDFEGAMNHSERAFL